MRKGEKVPQVQSSSAKCSQVTTSVGKEKWVLLMSGTTSAVRARRCVGPGTHTGSVLSTSGRKRAMKVDAGDAGGMVIVVDMDMKK